MEDLFPTMTKSVSKVAGSIEAELAKVYPATRKSLTDDQWTDYGDCLECLHTRLQQLNNTLHIEYSFTDGLPGDVINYARLLNQYKEPCEEKVGFLLSRGDDWLKYENLFLEEVLNGIIESSDHISKLFAS